VEPLHHLPLVRGVLRREPEHARAERGELGVQIAEATGVRRAAARAGDRVPVGDQRGFAGPSGARIREHDDQPRDRREVDAASVGRGKRDVRQPRPGEVRGGAVVERRREVRRQRGEAALVHHRSLSPVAFVHVQVNGSAPGRAIVIETCVPFGARSG
jgi:hypothetical protein